MLGIRLEPKLELRQSQPKERIRCNSLVRGEGNGVSFLNKLFQIGHNEKRIKGKEK